MAHSFLISDAQAVAFEARHSPAGLMARYARGRIRSFWPRQVLTLIGSLALALMDSVLTGLAAAALALLGESLDCLVLRRVPGWQAQGRSVAWVRSVTTATAAFQALTIACCILLTLDNAIGIDACFFAFAFLSGAAMNAGVVMPFHPWAAKMRLGIYLATGVGFLVGDIALSGTLEPHHGYEVLASVLMAYTLSRFLGLVNDAHHAHVRSSRELLSGAQALAQSNRDLQDTQREARQLALVARHASDTVILSDNLGRILWVNDAFVRMTGYSATEAVGQETGRLLNGPETSAETVASIQSAVREGQSLRCDILNYTKDGRKIWVDTNLVPICDEHGKTETVIGIERDVTEVRLRAEKLAQATTRAEEGARAKAVFLATMSHEIRTPMNGIIGMSDLLSESPLGPQQREYVSAIHSSAEALLRIIDDILDFSKLDAGKMATTEEPFNLARCIRMSADLLRGSARDKGLFLDICHDVPLPEIVVGDEGRVRQVLINLLGNAIKFTPTGGVTLRVHAERKGAVHVLRISVTDTGIGVPADRAERIFDQFEQADVATTRQFGGTGLGLAISRQLARRMGGDLVFEPGAGHGATFVFTFTAGVQPKERRAQPRDDTKSGPQILPDLTGLRIVLAEDNRTNSLLVARYLSDLGVTLWFASNGREAVDLVRQHRPDVVLMDVSMPELDGISATIEIRQSGGPQPHIIALTANAFASDRAACLDAGMNDFLPKPIRKAELMAALARGTVVHKPLGSPPPLRVSGDGQAQEAPNWTSQPASGTTSGRSTRSSGL